MVEAIVIKLAQKFNPTAQTKKDDLTLTHRRLEKNAKANVENGDELIFDPSVTTKGNLSDAFQIFAPKLNPTSPALCPLRDADSAPLTVFMDGSCLHNGQHNTISRAGIWIADGHPLNRAIWVPRQEQSNQTTEIAAIVVALQATPWSADLMIITDSRYAIQGLTRSLEHHEDTAWIGVPNTPWLKAAAYHLCVRSAPTKLKWVKGHNGTTGNEEADKLAMEGVRKPTPDAINLTVPWNFDPLGLHLCTLTPASAYAFLNACKPPTTSEQARINLERAQVTLKDINTKEMTDTNLWLKCRHPDIRRPVQAFLYKAMNGAFCISQFWYDIPQHAHKAHCASCNASPESLDHILVDCDNDAVATVWSVAQQTWLSSFSPWPDVQLSLILGCSSIGLPLEDDESLIHTGPLRLLRILLSESRHLIWVLCCECTIQGLHHSTNTIKSCWLNKINH